jgi:hypothetical protein
MEANPKTAGKAAMAEDNVHARRRRVGNAGIMSYYSRRRAVNLDGLVTLIIFNAAMIVPIPKRIEHTPPTFDPQHVPPVPLILTIMQ